jgi:AcrR family transcriptional regulator
VVKGGGEVERTGTANRTYGGLSADERRATRRRAILDAALDLFTEGGAQAVSKRAVCARARLNERYFYEQFSSADALLEAIIQDQTADVLGVVAAASAEVDGDLAARTRAIAGAALEFLAADPRRGALLLASYSSDVPQRTKRDSLSAIAKVIASLPPDPLAPAAADAADVELVAYGLVSGAMELIAGWLRGDLDISTARCADLVAGLLCSAPHVASTLPAPSRAGRSSRGGSR